MKIKKIVFLLTVTFGISIPVEAQRVLSLDSCRALALRNNKQLRMSKVNREMSTELQKSARTKSLPKVDGLGAYSLTSKEVSLLSDKQQNTLNHLGDNAGAQIQQAVSSQVGEEVAAQIGQMVATPLNSVGQEIRKAFRSNTRNALGGDILIRQPVYTGGAITATNRIADINVRTADDNIDLKQQSTIYDVDEAYWQVVSLRQKQLLAQQYLKLVTKFHDDVNKMLKAGVATRSNELRVAVRVNEAEMNCTKVDDGLELSRMHLCQICGLDLDSNIQLADENITDDATPKGTDAFTTDWKLKNQRPELRLLQDAVDLSEQNTKLVRSAFRPQVAAFGGYMLSTPNLLNSFNHDLDGMFHIGIGVRIPIWNWHEGRHKVRAAQQATIMAKMELADMTEKINLQVSQARFRLKEAYKKLNMARSDVKSAEENLRCANVGFKEGVIQTTDVMEAQTAWQSAQTEKIDALIDVRMADVNLRKALGTLNAESIYNH